MGRRGKLIALAAGLGAVGTVSVVVIDQRVMASIEPQTLVVPVLVGEAIIAEVTLRNAHPWRELPIQSVGTSCGCLTVVGLPTRVGAQSSEKIRLKVLIEPGGTRTLNRVRAQLPDGTILEGIIRAEPLDPFKGWPGYAEGEFDPHAQSTIVQLDPTYLDRIVAAQATTRDGVKVETMLDTEGGVIAFIDPGEDGMLSVTFLREDAEETWTGDIIHASQLAESPDP